MTINKKYYVYVIESIEKYKYTGMTENLELRLNHHNEKTLSLWTRRGSNWKVIYYEEFSNKSDALKKEQWLKTGIGREFIKKL